MQARRDLYRGIEVPLGLQSWLGEILRLDGGGSTKFQGTEGAGDLGRLVFGAHPSELRVKRSCALT